MTTPSLHERAKTDLTIAIAEWYKSGDEKVLDNFLAEFYQRTLSLAQEAVPGEKIEREVPKKKRGRPSKFAHLPKLTMTRIYPENVGWNKHRKETLLALSKLR